MKGDIVLLGNTSWRIRKIEAAGRILVEDAHGAPPSIPFWLGEAPGRTEELSRQLGELRQTISDMTPNTVPGFVNQKSAEVLHAVEWLKRECGLDDSGAEQAIEYVVTGRAVLGAVPSFNTIIAERFFDEGGGMQLVLHAPFGARINKAWGLSLRKRFCVSFNFELQAAATDNGVNIALAEQHSFPLADVFHFLHENTVKEVLQQAALLSPLLETRWRWDANRALALLRIWNGKKIPLQVQRTRSADLLASVFPDVAACQENADGPIQVPDHPLVREVMKDIFQEALDLEGLKHVLRQMNSGEIKCIAVDTPVPSVFSHEILNSNPFAFLDDAPLEERRARAVELRRTLPESVLKEVGALDPAAIEEVRAGAWPDVRDADELADTLQTLIALPEKLAGKSLPLIHTDDTDRKESILKESSFDDRVAQALLPVQKRPSEESVRPEPTEWSPLFEQLRSSRRATRAKLTTAQAGVPVLHNSSECWFWVSAEKAKAFRAIYPEAQFDDELPEVESESLSADDALKAMITGWLTHLGPTTASALAQLLRLPVAAATFMRWLLRWQHVAPGSQVRDEHGTLQVLRQLQGFEIPASAWERQVLARRISNYDPKILDHLCLTGAVGWGRLSPHPAMLEDSAGSGRRVVPTSVAPITFFVRDEAEWMALPSVRSAHQEAEKEIRGLGPGARDVLAFLRLRGASFFADIVRGSNKLKSEVETALWELVAAGLVTADGFDNLRALIDPKRRSGHGSGKTNRPRHSAGRWSLLYPSQGEDSSRAVESVC